MLPVVVVVVVVDWGVVVDRVSGVMRWSWSRMVPGWGETSCSSVSVPVSGEG